jgi:hypothetical protein
MGIAPVDGGQPRDHGDGQPGGGALRTVGLAALACAALAIADLVVSGEDAAMLVLLAGVAALAALAWLVGDRDAVASRRWAPAVALAGFGLGASGLLWLEAFLGTTPWGSSWTRAIWACGAAVAAVGVWLEGTRRGAAGEALIVLGAFGAGCLLLLPWLLVMLGAGGR